MVTSHGAPLIIVDSPCSIKTDKVVFIYSSQTEFKQQAVIIHSTLF